MALAGEAPVNGVQVAIALRPAGGPVRGEKASLIDVNGLLTRFSTPADYDIDGRRYQPLPEPPLSRPQLEPMLCDPAKLHEDLRTNLLAIGDPESDVPYLVYQACPFGRRKDEFESMPFDQDEIRLIAPIQAIDTANYTLQAGGASIALNPGATITSVENSGGSLKTLPLRMQDLHVGDRVRILPARTPGESKLVDELWAGPAFESGEDILRSYVIANSRPDIQLQGGFTVHTNLATSITYQFIDQSNGGCELATGSPDDFWAADVSNPVPLLQLVVEARGNFSGSVFEATEVDIAPQDPNYCIPY
jgi:hypothetical protein